MKTAVKITIELLLLAGAIYIKYVDEDISSKIEEIHFIDSLILFLIYVLILRFFVSIVKLLYRGRKKIKRRR